MVPSLKKTADRSAVTLAGCSLLDSTNTLELQAITSGRYIYVLFFALSCFDFIGKRGEAGELSAHLGHN